MSSAERVSFADWVIERLATATGSACYRYLLIDLSPLHGTNLAASVASLGPARDVISADAPDWRVSAVPVLISLPDSAGVSAWRKRARKLLDMLCYANCASYLESPLKGESLSQALRSRAHASLADGTGILLRFFDTRVMNAVNRVLPSEDRNRFFSPSSLWTIHTRDGHVHTLSDKQTQEPLIDYSPVLAEQQQLDLLESAEADSILDLLHQQEHVQLAPLTPPEQYRKVGVLLATGRRYGIRNAPDQAAFCSLGLTLGESFHTQGPWAELLASFRDKQVTFSQVLERAEAQFAVVS